MKILIYIKKLDVESTLTFVINDILGLKAKAEILVLTSISSNVPESLENNVVRFNLNERNKLYRIQNFCAIHDIAIWYFNVHLRNYYSKVINNFKPDLIITHFGDESLLFLQNIRVKLPIMVMFHGYDASAWLKVKSYIKFYKKLFRKSNFIPITCSENMKSRMEKVGIPMGNSFVIYYGIDNKYFSNEKKSHNRIPIFLQISSFNEKKGHAYTIQAFKKYLEIYPNDKFKLILAGEGRLKESIINLSKELKMNSYINFPGWVNREKAKKLLSEADYFVHHSITDRYGNMEGIPNALIEAMSMGLPVISTYHSGIPELVADRKNGILVKEKNVNEYALAIKEIKKINCFVENVNKVANDFNINKRIYKLYSIIRNQVNEKY